MKHLVKLKDIASYSKGTQINGDDLANDAEYKYLNGGINPSGKWKEANCMANTVTISEGGNSCGYVNYMTEPFWCGAHCYYIYDTIKNTQYLYYALKSQQDRIMELRSGACMPNIKKGDLGNFKFIIDDDSYEQEKISTVLGKLEKLKRVREYELIELNNLVRGRFVELFGDPIENPKRYYVATLQELIDKDYITYHLDGNHGGDYPRSEEFVASGVPYISANCIVNGEIDFSKAKFLTSERAGKLRKGIAQDEDVLFAHNATVGPTVVLHTDEEKVILGTSLTAYRCNKDEIMPNYLKAYMLSDGFVRQYSGEMKQTTRNQVPITAQKKYLFLIPPIKEQNQFADFVHQIDKSKLIVQKELDETQLLFDSLMQEYFG